MVSAITETQILFLSRNGLKDGLTLHVHACMTVKAPQISLSGPAKQKQTHLIPCPQAYIKKGRTPIQVYPVLNGCTPFLDVSLWFVMEMHTMMQ